MRILLAAALLLAPVAASGQSLAGPVRAIDGDTLAMTGTRIRLFGIDAPEIAQTCTRLDKEWACGKDASDFLAGLVEGRQVNCLGRGKDSYGRTVATCVVGRIDLAEELVRARLAIALPQFSDSYLANEDRARELGIGIWGSQFDEPGAWRAVHGDPQPQNQVATGPRELAGGGFARRQDGGRESSEGVYFFNCDEARAYGYAPMNRGEPGYRSGLDGDNDGIACESFRGRG